MKRVKIEKNERERENKCQEKKDKVQNITIFGHFVWKELVSYHLG